MPDYVCRGKLVCVGVRVCLCPSSFEAINKYANIGVTHLTYVAALKTELRGFSKYY